MEKKEKNIGKKNGIVAGNLCVQAAVYNDGTAALRFYNNKQEKREYTQFCAAYTNNVNVIFDMINRSAPVSGEHFVDLASSTHAIKESKTGVTLMFFACGVLYCVKTNDEDKTVELQKVEEIKIKGTSESINLHEQNCFSIVIANGEDPNYAYAVRLGNRETHEQDNELLILDKNFQGYERRFNYVSSHPGKGLKISEGIVNSATLEGVVKGTRLEGIVSSDEPVGFKDLNITSSKTVDFGDEHLPSIQCLRGFNVNRMIRNGEFFRLQTSVDGRNVQYSGRIQDPDRIFGRLEMTISTKLPSSVIKDGRNLEFDGQEFEGFIKQDGKDIKSFGPLHKRKKDSMAPNINISGTLLGRVIRKESEPTVVLPGKEKSKDTVILPNGDIMKINEKDGKNIIIIRDHITNETKAEIMKYRDRDHFDDVFRFTIMVNGKPYGFKGYTNPNDEDRLITELKGPVNGKEYVVDITDETSFEDIVEKIKKVILEANGIQARKQKSFYGGKPSGKYRK